MTNEKIVYDALTKYIKEHGKGPLTPVLVEMTQLSQLHVSEAVRSLSRSRVISMEYRSYGTIRIEKPFSEFRETPTERIRLKSASKPMKHTKPFVEKKMKVRRFVQECIEQGMAVPHAGIIGGSLGISRRHVSYLVTALADDGVIKMTPRKYDTIVVRKRLVSKGITPTLKVDTIEAGDQDRVFRLIYQAVVLRNETAPKLPVIMDTLGLKKTKASKIINQLLDQGRLVRTTRSYTTIRVAPGAVPADERMFTKRQVQQASEKFFRKHVTPPQDNSNRSIIDILNARREELVTELNAATQTVIRVEKLLVIIDETSDKLASI